MNPHETAEKKLCDLLTNPFEMGALSKHFSRTLWFKLFSLVFSIVFYISISQFLLFDEFVVERAELCCGVVACLFDLGKLLIFLARSKVSLPRFTISLEWIHAFSFHKNTIGIYFLLYRHLLLLWHHAWMTFALALVVVGVECWFLVGLVFVAKFHLFAIFYASLTIIWNKLVRDIN